MSDGELEEKTMAYWLLKTEPDVFSWDDQVKRGAKGEPWTGVRNFTARRYLKEMKKGEHALFYHTGAKLRYCARAFAAHPSSGRGARYRSIAQIVAQPPCSPAGEPEASAQFFDQSAHGRTRQPRAVHRP